MTTFTASERGRAVETRLGKETTLNQAPAAGWKPCRFYDIGSAGMGRELVKDEQLGVAAMNTRDSGRRKLGLPGGSLARNVPLNLSEIGHYLSAGFARAAPSGAGPNYVHVFTSGADPADSLTLVQKWATGDWTWDMGVALASMRIQAQKAETTARASLTLIGLSDAEGSAAPAGTLDAAYAAEDFSDWRWQVLWNDVAVGDALNLDLNLDCGVERIQGLSGDEWPTKHHFGDRDASGSFRLYGRGKAIRDLGAANTAGKLTLKATHPSDPTNRFIKFDLEGAQFNKPQRGVGGPGQFSADMSFAASQDATHHAVTVTLANGVATY